MLTWINALFLLSATVAVLLSLVVVLRESRTHTVVLRGILEVLQRLEQRTR